MCRCGYVRRDKQKGKPSRRHAFRRNIRSDEPRIIKTFFALVHMQEHSSRGWNSAEHTHHREAIASPGRLKHKLLIPQTNSVLFLYHFYYVHRRRYCVEKPQRQHYLYETHTRPATITLVEFDRGPMLDADLISQSIQRQDTAVED